MTHFATLANSDIDKIITVLATYEFCLTKNSITQNPYRKIQN